MNFEATEATQINLFFNLQIYLLNPAFLYGWATAVFRQYYIYVL